jgi:neocarzinostatin family protein
MRRFMTGIASATLILGGLTSLGLATTASAAGPTIQVTPSTGLTNGTAVSVAGTGFQDNETVYALECINDGASTNETDCDTSTVSIATTSATGTFTASVTVVAGTVAGTSTCGTTSTDLSSCAIVVSTNPPSADAALFPITFALPSPTTTTTTTIPVKVGPRKFHVAPVKNLKNGSRVKVWGTGFKPHDQVYVIECLATSKSEAGCDLKTLHPVKITATGVLPAFNFKVVTGKIGTGTCGTTAKNLKSCAISVANATKGDSGQVRITFK